jgi:nitrate reductase assembly molybdenum cofactor insertion protein NarJ
MAGLGGGSPSGDEGPQNKGLEASHREAAEYIASMLEALQQVAGSAKMPFLAYLINVALEEARLEKAQRD